ncbi:MAG: acyltransferase [Arachidicoccus sp.]|nr:acyltransferase [Arachidicoccus sp.]
MPEATDKAIIYSKHKFYGLDHLRAFAIFFVFLYHYPAVVKNVPDWLLTAGQFGWTGVDLFFGLSGFLISSQLFAHIKKAQHISLKEFYLKRFFRIIPVYLVTISLYFLLPFFREREALNPLWKFLTFTQNFGLDLQHYGTFSHAWSLCVEEHFYLLLPLILLLLLRTKFFRKSYWLIIVLFLFGLIIRMYNYNHFYLLNINKDNAAVYWYKYIYYPT